VAVLLGGTSSEREVSLTSGAAVVEALGRSDAVRRVEAVDWRADDHFAFDGGEPLDAGAALERLRDFDACFLALHGGRGEDGTVQGWLEMAGVAYTGSGVAASSLALDKHATRAVASGAGLRVADGVLVRRGDDLAAALAPLIALDAPSYFAKDRWGGSSIGTRRIDGADGLIAGVADGFATSSDLVVEVGVRGVEVSCPVVTFDGRHRAWPLVEIVPRGEAFFDYEQKYHADGALERCPPQLVDAAAQRTVAAHAERIAHDLGCAGLCRVDFLVPESGAPVLLEVNTLPGMTPRSLVRQCAEEIGLDYGALCLELLRDALRRRGRA